MVKKKNILLIGIDRRYNLNVIGQRVDRMMYRTQRFTYLRVMKSKEKHEETTNRVDQAMETK